MAKPRFLRDIRLGVENLLLHKLRTFLTMLGLVFGVGSVVTMLSVGEGAGKKALDQIRKLGSNNIIITSKKNIEAEAAGSATKFMGIYGLTYLDHLRIVETFETARHAVAAKLVRKKARFGERSLELRVVGTSPQWFELIERPLVAGRRLSEEDYRNLGHVCVLTEHAARKLLAVAEPLGALIRIGRATFRVVGIVRSEEGLAGSIQVPDSKIDVYIPLPAARNIYGDIIMRITSGSRELDRVELHRIIVAADAMENVVPLATGIEAMLRKFHPKGDYTLSVPLTILKQAEATKRTFNIVLGSIACISLLVGGIGIMNIMLASVTERTKEIGIRRAIGARRGQIIGQFLIETVVLSCAGGLLGTGLGFLIPRLITKLTGLPTIVTLESILVSALISIGTGIVFGIYPARRAASVDPIVALRHE